MKEIKLCENFYVSNYSILKDMGNGFIIIKLAHPLGINNNMLPKDCDTFLVKLIGDNTKLLNCWFRF